MNWRQIDKCWKEYSEKNKLELEYFERNVVHGIECKYVLKIKSNNWDSVFSGILWNTQSGHNFNRTIISIMFLNQSNKTLKLNNNIFKNLLFRSKLNVLEKNILSNFLKLNGKFLELNQNELEIQLNKVISHKSEFNELISLIEEIEFYRGK